MSQLDSLFGTDMDSMHNACSLSRIKSHMMEGHTKCQPLAKE